MTYFYQLFGKRIQTNFSLGDLPHSRPGIPSFRIRINRGKLKTKPSSWYHQTRFENGRLFCSFGKVKQKFFIRSHGNGDIVFSSKSKTVDIYLSRCSIENVQSLVLNQVLPYVLNLAGFQVLHASAVAKGKKAIVLMGDSGQGKSTLASAFVMRGYRLLTDDALPVKWLGKKAIAFPSYPETRLSEGVGRMFMGDEKFGRLQPAFHKKRIPFSKNFSMGSIQVRQIFLLEQTEKTKRQVSFSSLGPKESWLELMRHVFRVDLFNPKRMKKEMSDFAAMSEKLSVVRVAYSQNFRNLPNLIEAIEKYSLPKK